jgi:DNA-binding SARP family transcriptional activator
MVALCRGGRQAEALEVYRSARRTSIGQLGLEPGPELRALERTILTGEAVGAGREPRPAPDLFGRGQTTRR